MSDHDLTVLAERLSFHYLTPKREPLIPGFPILKRIRMEKKEVLHGIDVRIRANRITALLGRNGSGKTTLIKIISGMRFPHSGAIKVFGESVHKVRHRIGVCAGASLIYNRLTARENLEYFGQLYNVQNLRRRIIELADILQLGDSLDQMVETYSFGMRAKLAIARSLIHSPDFLILDEPTLGIDLELAIDIRKFIRSLKCTVLLTTHYMEEAEMLADDLCIINQGTILDSGTKGEVMARFGKGSVAEAFTSAVNQMPKAIRCAS